MRHILLTNDFPPKVGGIQSYLWELWRRLPPEDVVVFTASSHPDGERWDDQQPFEVVRSDERVLLPHPGLVRRVRAEAQKRGAGAVVIDPAFPLGLLGPRLGLPYAVVLHGAEVTVPGRLPLSRALLAGVLRGAGLVIAAGHYPEAQARRAVGPGGRFPLVAQVPPGVDTGRFHPLGPQQRAEARRRWGLPLEDPVVLSTSRLVPRKGVDTLIEAASRLAPSFPGLTVAVGSAGRDRPRLEKMAAGLGPGVRFLGRVPDEALAPLYAAADVFALCCRSRWWGLEQEGFGIVLLEAAAAGVPCLTIDSGGAGEAVVDGVTGAVVVGVDRPTVGLAPAAPRGPQVAGVAEALASLLKDRGRAAQMGRAGRARAEEDFSYDVLARRLATALDRWH